jgi:FkbM family methyltransferase
MNLIFKSLQLDIEFFNLQLSLADKLTFIFKKYLTLLNIFIYGLKEEKHVKVFDNDYFYDDKFGIGILQTTFVDNYYLKNFISDNSIVIDIGANIGQFNIFCKKYLNSKKVYSFEPVNKTYRYLKKNCKENVFNVAISTKKRILFYFSSFSVWASAIKPKANNIKPEIVNGMTLDSIAAIQKLPMIDLLKIDVEGAEKDALLASKRVIKKSRYVLIEVSLSREAVVDGLEIVDILRKFSPGIKLIRIGKVYNGKDGKTGAADFLFSTKLNTHTDI